ncbi:MAG TPA: hypothetical protein VF532_05455 [Candidatus Angelobacter sp.]
MKSNKVVMVVAIIVAVVVGTAVMNYDKWLPHRWQTYTAPDGTFSIELPGQPAIETTQAPLDDGRTAPMTLVSVQPTGSTAYMCSYVENDNFANKTPDEILEAARDGSLKKTQGTLVSQSRLTVQGYPALDIQAQARENSVTDSRMVLAGKRLYMIVAVAGAQEREPKTVQRVFNSFKMINP